MMYIQLQIISSYVHTEGELV